MEEAVHASERRLLRVAITGPESTGKTTLAKSLAERYNTVWVPEYARSYLEKLGRPYEEEDLVKIAEGQIASDKSLETKANRILFCDTEMLVLKIWSEYRYKRCDRRILSLLKAQRYDLYFLTAPDMPWEPDPLRENSSDRAYLFHLYKIFFAVSRLHYRILTGSQSDRTEQAVEIISRSLKLGFPHS